MGYSTGGGGGASTSIEGAQACLTVDGTFTADNTIRAMAWDDEVYDDAAYHDTVTNNSRLTIPAGKGGAGTRFRIETKLDISLSTNNLSVYLRKNGTARAVGAIVFSGESQSECSLAYTDSAPADGDYWEVIYSKVSTNATLNSAYDLVGTKRVGSWFAITKLK